MKLKSRTNNLNPKLIILSIIVCFMVIGYAVLSRTIKVNGTAKVPATSWDIHFENVVVQEGSVIPTTAATISDKTTVGFNVKLNQPKVLFIFSRC